MYAPDPRPQAAHAAESSSAHWRASEQIKVWVRDGPGGIWHPIASRLVAVVPVCVFPPPAARGPGGRARVAVRGPRWLSFTLHSDRHIHLKCVMNHDATLARVLYPWIYTYIRGERERERRLIS